ncbi:MAG TPA: hypothetical protein VKR59_07855 [Terriglobales bacterium]|nr:hypothetical protein [Terriglobales bacterium]
MTAKKKVGFIDPETFAQTFIAQAPDDCFDANGDLNDKGQVAMFRYLDSVMGTDSHLGDAELLVKIKAASAK